MVGLGRAAKDHIHKGLVEDSRQGQGIDGGVVLCGKLAKGVPLGLEAGRLITRGETAVGQRFFNDDAQSCLVRCAENGRCRLL